MLPEWYFSCCLEAGPAATKAFLSMLEIIEDPESDSRLMHLTFQELKRADIRMQIYALPYLIRAAQVHQANIKTADATLEYFDRLTKLVPESLSESLNLLFEGVLLGAKASLERLSALVLYLKDLKALPTRRRSSPS